MCNAPITKTTLEVTEVRQVGGEREITTATPSIPTLNRNNKKNQHEDSSRSLDVSRKTFVPPSKTMKKPRERKKKKKSLVTMSR